MDNKGPARAVPETSREREALRYGSSLVANAIHNGPSSPILPAQLRSSPDPALTSFAELAALRLGVARALISLFDTRFQYIIAEATQTLPLAPGSKYSDTDEQRLWLCGTAIPRMGGICDLIVVNAEPDLYLARSGAIDLPVTVIPDLAADPRLAGKSNCHVWPHNRFYAGVPIRTKRHINIGVLCVFDDKPRQELDGASITLLRDLSNTIMGYLESKSSKEGYRRADRMVRGLGSFVEDKATISGWKLGPDLQFLDDTTALEGGLNANQQRILQEDGAKALPPEIRHLDADEDPMASDDTSQSNQSTIVTAVTTGERSLHSSGSGSVKTGEDSLGPDVKYIFSRAANIIRESVEVEGVLFLDASIGSFGGFIGARASGKGGSRSNSSASSSHDEMATPFSTDRNMESGESTERAELAEDSEACCPVLGFSTTTRSSVDGDPDSSDHLTVPERFLATLLRRYPSGKIFNFNLDGSRQTSDTSGDELVLPLAIEGSGVLQDAQPAKPGSNEPRKQKGRPFSRQNEGKTILSSFPGARSIAFVPIWDTQKQRWLAGGIVYTKNPTRLLTVEGELSFLRAFTAVIMGEVGHARVTLWDKAKTDLLNSLSHELRSPLHGVILGAELLHDTPLTAFQGDVLHLVETCGRTLLDTMDHLLDWSKINNFMQASKRMRGASGRGSDRGLRQQGKVTIEAGMMSISANVDMGVLAEEVVESVCAGYSFQRLSIARLAAGSYSEHADANALRKLDSMQAVEDMTTVRNRTGGMRLVLQDVSISIKIDPEVSWGFHTQPGALRRIIMNLLGNSLKYTDKGFVEVSLSQQAPADKSRRHIRIVQITVADSGRGISEDYLRNHLFRPFSQEDSLAAGSGLGLSLVKQVAMTLNGSIQVQSQVGRGTIVTVKVPLQLAAPDLAVDGTPPDDFSDEFRAQVNELGGLRLLLAGFLTESGSRANEGPFDLRFDERVSIAAVCQDWLRMQVIDPKDRGVVVPDLLLFHERQLDRLSSERRNDSSAPALVICRNALVAHQLATTPRYAGKQGVYEFISQPVGARKLAKMLVLCFRRWTKLQAAAVRTTSTRSSMAGGDDLASGISASVFSKTEARPEVATESRGEVDGSASFESPPAQFLLVDDNPVNIRILAAYMSKLHYSFETAMDGQQAIDAFRQGAGHYKCIFMDISMPVMDGFEAARRIRAWEAEMKTPRCHIFALTGLASKGAQQEAFASGIDLFLTKPVRLTELTQILATRGIT